MSSSIIMAALKKNNFMKSSILIIRLFLWGALFISQVQAQAICSQDSLLNTKGSWKKGSDWTGLTIKYPVADKKAMVKIQDNIQGLILNAYPQPRGMQATWNHQ